MDILQFKKIENNIITFQRWRLKNRNDYYEFIFSSREAIFIFSSDSKFEEIATKKEVIKLKLSKIEKREKKLKNIMIKNKYYIKL
jgi:hypothetical protein